jgi:hypothetical protein
VLPKAAGCGRVPREAPPSSAWESAKKHPASARGDQLLAVIRGRQAGLMSYRDDPALSAAYTPTTFADPGRLPLALGLDVPEMWELSRPSWRISIRRNWGSRGGDPKSRCRSASSLPITSSSP